MYYCAHYHSPLGEITLASNGTALTGLWFDGQKYFGASLPADTPVSDLPVFRQTVEWLDVYFGGRKPEGAPAVHLCGSPFQLAVWTILQSIPYGETRTYKEIAADVARRRGLKSMSAQAAGGAVGRNPVSLIIPCHRVLGSNGSLTGYAGGIGRKACLLELERTGVMPSYPDAR